MKKAFSTFLMAVVLTALLLLPGAASASADTPYTFGGSSCKIVNNLVVKDDANIPYIEFTYSIVPGPAMASTSGTMEIMESPVRPFIETSAFSDTDTKEAILGLPADIGFTTLGRKYVPKAFTVTFPAQSFTTPGIYRYTIIEDSISQAGVKCDSPLQYLDVTVTADDDNSLKIEKYTLRDAVSPISSNGSYTSHPERKSHGYVNFIEQYDFLFTKEITGNQGEKDFRFTFFLQIENAVPGTYPLEATSVPGDPSTIIVGPTGSFTGSFDMKDGSSLKVIGLNKGAVCTISEGASDYNVSYRLDGGNSITGNTSSAITMNADHTVNFTNDKTAAIHANMMMSVAPFTGSMLIFGMILIAVVSRLKSDDDD